MEVLIIGDSNSIWLKSIIANTLNCEIDHITILTLSNNVYSNYYESHNIDVKLIKQGKHLHHIGDLFNGLRNRAILCDEYDLVLLHFVAIPYMSLLPMLRMRSKKIIISFWGSDILRLNHKRIVRNKVIKILLNYADRITMSTAEMEAKFRKEFGRGFSDKIVRTHFGSQVVAKMQEIECEDICTIKEQYAITRDKVVISVGYNGYPGQQHLRVLEVITRLSDEDRNKIHLLLRLTYGLPNDEYLERVKEMVQRTGCTYSIFTNYLTEEEVAKLTEVTDVFVHAQTSDARSASMCEHLFAGCVVMNPTWISYSELKDRVFYLTFSDDEDLMHLIKDNIVPKRESKYYPKLISNKRAIYQMTSWEIAREEWIKAYE